MKPLLACLATLLSLAFAQDCQADFRLFDHDDGFASGAAAAL